YPPFCRVLSYLGPGSPSPTMAFTAHPPAMGSKIKNSERKGRSPGRALRGTGSKAGGERRLLLVARRLLAGLRFFASRIGLLGLRLDRLRSEHRHDHFFPRRIDSDPRRYDQVAHEQ